MDDDFLNRVDQFNRELTASVAAGIGIDIGIESGLNTSSHKKSLLAADDFSQHLKTMRDALALRISLRQSPHDAVDQEASLTPRYRAALQCCMACDNPAAVLEAISRSAVDHQALDRSIRLALARIYMVAVLAFVGLAISSFWLSPAVDSTYKQLRINPDGSAVWLLGIRTWLPIWATIVTAGCLVIGIVLHRSSSAWVTWLAMRMPQARRYAEMKAHARFADQVALLLRHNLTIEKSIPIAARLAGNNEPETSSHQTQTVAQPPLIQWAIHESDDPSSCVQSLRTAATLYRQIAQRQAVTWTRALPAVVGAIICGVFVLVYAVTIFAPIISLLDNITMPGLVMRIIAK